MHRAAPQRIVTEAIVKQHVLVQYVSDTQLAARYSVSRSTIWRWACSGILPTPVRLSSCCTRWRLDLIEQREAERDVETVASERAQRATEASLVSARRARKLDQ